MLIVRIVFFLLFSLVVRRNFSPCHTGHFCTIGGAYLPLRGIQKCTALNTQIDIAGLGFCLMYIMDSATFFQCSQMPFHGGVADVQGLCHVFDWINSHKPFQAHRCTHSFRTGWHDPKAHCIPAMRCLAGLTPIHLWGEENNRSA